MSRVEVGAEEFGDPPFIAATPSPTSSSDPIILVTPRIIHSGSPIYGSDACFLCFVIECHREWLKCHSGAILAKFGVKSILDDASILPVISRWMLFELNIQWYKFLFFSNVLPIRCHVTALGLGHTHPLQIINSGVADIFGKCS